MVEQIKEFAATEDLKHADHNWHRIYKEKFYSLIREIEKTANDVDDIKSLIGVSTLSLASKISVAKGNADHYKDCANGWMKYAKKTHRKMEDQFVLREQAERELGLIVEDYSSLLERFNLCHKALKSIVFNDDLSAPEIMLLYTEAMGGSSDDI